jgi:hypothetical protein
MEVLVLPFVPTGVQNYFLGVDPLPAGARGGVAYFGAAGNEVRDLTAALRQGTSQFLLSFGAPALAAQVQAEQATAATASSGQASTPRAGSADTILSELAALVSVRGTRSDALTVTPITPLPGPGQAVVSPGPAVTVAAGGETARQIAGGGGTQSGPFRDRVAIVQWLLDRLVELGRALPPDLARRLRSWLVSLGLRLTLGMDRPVPERPDRGAVVLPEEDAESPPPDEAGTADTSPESSPPRSGASLVVVAGLVSGYLLRRDGSGDRKKFRGTRPDRSRRPDHGE